MVIRLGGALALTFLLLAINPARAAECPAATGSVRTLAPKITARPIVVGAACAKGEIISGPSAGPHPGVLFVHWLGDPKTTNHTEFEADAVALARRGVTSVLVDAMWSREDWFDKVGVSAEADVAQASGQLAGLSAALDLLERQKGIDPHRIAYVGHDFGAMFGALLAGDDPRPSYIVLMAGVPTLSEWYLLGKTHSQKDAYVRALDALDITASLGRSKAKAFLFQFAAHDHYIAADRATAFAAASPLPRAVMTYDADHSLAVPQAAGDRRAWLLEHLFPPQARHG